MGYGQGQDLLTNYLKMGNHKNPLSKIGADLATKTASAASGIFSKNPFLALTAFKGFKLDTINTLLESGKGSTTNFLNLNPGQLQLADTQNLSLNLGQTNQSGDQIGGESIDTPSYTTNPQALSMDVTKGVSNTGRSTDGSQRSAILYGNLSGDQKVSSRNTNILKTNGSSVDPLSVKHGGELLKLNINYLKLFK